MTQKFTVKTLKNSELNGVESSPWNLGREGWHFAPNHVAMKGSNYINVLKEHLTISRIHQGDRFMHDGAPAQKS